jgi:hypothetical protein
LQKGNNYLKRGINDYKNDIYKTNMDKTIIRTDVNIYKEQLKY